MLGRLSKDMKSKKARTESLVLAGKEQERTCDDGALNLQKHNWLVPQSPTANDAPPSSCLRHNPARASDAATFTFLTGSSTDSCCPSSSHPLRNLACSAKTLPSPGACPSQSPPIQAVHNYLPSMSLAPFIAQLGAEIDDASEGDCLDPQPQVLLSMVTVGPIQKPSCFSPKTSPLRTLA